MTHALVGVTPQLDRPCSWFIHCACSPLEFCGVITAHEGSVSCPLNLAHTYQRLVQRPDGQGYELDAEGNHVYEIVAEPVWVVTRSGDRATFKPSINAEPGGHFHTSNPVTTLIRA